MEVGKLPQELLAKLLSAIPIGDERVVLGPRPGEDAALIDMGEKLLVAKTDPVTFATDLIGWYAVQVNANDLASMGARPRWFMATLLLPETTTPSQVEEVFSQVTSACQALGITLVGGHTEITYQLPRPIVVGAMLGEVEKERVVLTSGARPGDSIILTKGIPIEGAALLARDAQETLLKAGVGPDIIARAKEYLFQPGISVVEEALAACDAVEIHSMHDPTEGGLATGLLEVATAAKAGVFIDQDSIPLLPEGQAICQALGLDPLGLLASGALLLTLAQKDVPRLKRTLEQKGVSSHEIGRVTGVEEGLKLGTREGVKDLPTFPRDELARFFSLH